MKNFTKRQFDALTNELVRLVRGINSTKDYHSELCINRKTVTLWIFKNNGSVSTFVTFQKGRFGYVPSFSFFYSMVTKTLPKSKLGKYLTLITQSYADCDKDEDFFEF